VGLAKRQRFQELRARGEACDAAEQTELAALVKEPGSRRIGLSGRRDAAVTGKTEIR